MVEIDPEDDVWKFALGLHDDGFEHACARVALGRGINGEDKWRIGQLAPAEQTDDLLHRVNIVCADRERLECLQHHSVR